MSELERRIKSIAAGNTLLWKALKKGQEWQYDLQYQRFYGPFSTRTASICEINIEFCSACNLRCRFCALDHLKPRSYMSPGVLDKVFDTLLYDERFSRVRQINLHNGGETLLHPKRVELFKRIKLHKSIFEKHQRAFPKIILLTNGMLLRERLARELLELKILDEVGFSLDGGSPQAFEDMRVNAKWKRFAENVKQFSALRDEIDPGVKTFGICIVPEPHPLNDSWMHLDFREVARLLNSVEYRRLHDWGGQVDIGGGAGVNKKGCSMLINQMVILPTGEVTVCCNDLNGEGIVGNLLEESLYGIYSGEKRMRYVNLLRQGRKEELELCKECVSF